MCRIGKYSESARQFPEKINTQIMKVLDRTHITTEVYERGAGYTPVSYTHLDVYKRQCTSFIGGGLLSAAFL